MERILKKSYKILIISIIIFCIAVFVFFYGRKDGQKKSGGSFWVEPLSPGFQSGNGTMVLDGVGKNFPAPEKFNDFIFDSKSLILKSLKISGICSDAYYAVLIFSINDDYRGNPTAAKFNRAFSCPNDKKINQEIDLSSLHLLSGKYYYFVADQGASGSWYDPR